MSILDSGVALESEVKLHRDENPLQILEAKSGFPNPKNHTTGTLVSF